MIFIFYPLLRELPVSEVNLLSLYREAHMVITRGNRRASNQNYSDCECNRNWLFCFFQKSLVSCSSSCPLEMSSFSLFSHRVCFGLIKTTVTHPFNHPFQPHSLVMMDNSSVFLSHKVNKAVSDG